MPQKSVLNGSASRFTTALSELIAEAVERGTASLREDMETVKTGQLKVVSQLDEIRQGNEDLGKRVDDLGRRVDTISSS